MVSSSRRKSVLAAAMSGSSAGLVVGMAECGLSVGVCPMGLVSRAGHGFGQIDGPGLWDAPEVEETPPRQQRGVREFNGGDLSVERRRDRVRLYGEDGRAGRELCWCLCALVEQDGVADGKRDARGQERVKPTGGDRVEGDRIHGDGPGHGDGAG